MLMFRPSWPTWVLRDDPLILPTDLAPACQSVKMPLPLWNDVHHRTRRITVQRLQRLPRAPGHVWSSYFEHEGCSLARCTICLKE